MFISEYMKLLNSFKTNESVKFVLFYKNQLHSLIRMEIRTWREHQIKHLVFLLCWIYLRKSINEFSYCFLQIEEKNLKLGQTQVNWYKTYLITSLLEQIFLIVRSISLQKHGQSLERSTYFEFCWFFFYHNKL